MASVRLCETLARPFLRLARLFLSIARWSARRKRSDQAFGGSRHFFDSTIERVFVGTRRLIHPAQFADELQRRRADFGSGRGRLEVREGLDVAAHDSTLMWAMVVG